MRPARKASLRKRGRKAGPRRVLALFVGRAFAQAGFRPTTSRGGQFADVLKVVYSAAGFKVPDDLYPDAAFVLDFARNVNRPLKDLLV